MTTHQKNPVESWEEDFKFWYYDNHMHYNITGSNRESYEDDRFDQFERYIRSLLSTQRETLLGEIEGLITYKQETAGGIKEIVLKDDVRSLLLAKKEEK